jgi:hypothetical protein
MLHAASCLSRFKAPTVIRADTDTRTCRWPVMGWTPLRSERLEGGGPIDRRPGCFGVAGRMAREAAEASKQLRAAASQVAGFRGLPASTKFAGRQRGWLSQSFSASVFAHPCRHPLNSGCKSRPRSLLLAWRRVQPMKSNASKAGGPSSSRSRRASWAKRGSR